MSVVTLVEGQWKGAVGRHLQESQLQQALNAKDGDVVVLSTGPFDATVQTCYEVNALAQAIILET